MIGLLEYKGNHAEYRGWIRDLWKQEFPMKSWRKPEVFITGTNLSVCQSNPVGESSLITALLFLITLAVFAAVQTLMVVRFKQHLGGHARETGEEKAQMLPYCCVSAEPTPVYLIASQGSPAKVIATGGSLLWRMTLKILHAKPSNPA